MRGPPWVEFAPADAVDPEDPHRRAPTVRILAEATPAARWRRSRCLAVGAFVVLYPPAVVAGFAWLGRSLGLGCG